MGRVSHAPRRCSRYSLEDHRGACLSPRPSSRGRLLSEALQKRRGGLHRRAHHICEGLRAAVDTPDLLQSRAGGGTGVGPARGRWWSSVTPKTAIAGTGGSARWGYRFIPNPLGAAVSGSP